MKRRIKWHNSRLLRISTYSICTVGFIIQAFQIYRIYITYPYTVSIVEEVRQNLKFPAITICLDEWMDIELVRKYYPSRASTAGLKITTGVYHVQFDPEMRNKTALSPKKLFRCSMKSSLNECNAFRCTDIFQLTYYRAPVSMCYTVDPTRHENRYKRFKECPQPWTWEMEIKAVWTIAKTLAAKKTGKFPLIVHGTNIVPPDRMASVTIKPGLSYTLLVAQKTIERLPAPYGSDCTDYFGMGPRDEFMGYMTKDVLLMVKTE